ncbi:MAG: hypothetical protein JWR05_3230 [Mucilaginibacter sp.]|nr:hypothetical protein [Mucilaginibacter sp.]
MSKIFITGVTGFLGSKIAGYLIGEGHEVCAIYREKSSRERSLLFIDKVNWIVQDEKNEWIEHIIETRPEVIIHAAWLGVSHIERNSWDQQFLNINFLQQILSIAQKAGSSKFIGLGSQAEYGVYNGCIDENYPLNPVEAYGHVKIICSEMIKQFCLYHKIDSYWLRLFSFFGEGESEDWLIPSLIKKIALSDNMDLTLGEQRYSYLYANDLGLAVNKIIVNEGNSGIYNISGRVLITLKNLIESIRDSINSEFTLNFGKLPYRPNQSMHMQGNSAKFIDTFGEFEVSDFDDAMSKTVRHFKEKFKA